MYFNFRDAFTMWLQRMGLWSELRSGTTFYCTSGLKSWEQKVMSGAIALSPTLVVIGSASKGH